MSIRVWATTAVLLFALIVNAQVFPFPPRSVLLFDTLAPNPPNMCSRGIEIKFVRPIDRGVFRIDLRDFQVGICSMYLDPRSTTFFNARSYEVTFDGIDRCGAQHFSGTRIYKNVKYYLRIVDQRELGLNCRSDYAKTAITVIESNQYGAKRMYFLPQTTSLK